MAVPLGRMPVIQCDFVTFAVWRPKYLIFLSFGREEFATAGSEIDSNRKEDQETHWAIV